MPNAIIHRPDRTALVVIGPPASGKDKLCHEFARAGFEVIGAGDVARKAGLALPPGLILSAKKRKAARIKLDDRIGALVATRICMNRSGFIAFNGFPRRPFHAAALDMVLKAHGYRPDEIHIVALQAREKVLWERMRGRRDFAATVGHDPRPEDNDATFRVRLGAYWHYSHLVHSYYGKRLNRIDANGDFEQVQKQVMEAFRLQR